MPYYVRQPDGTYKEMIDDAVISSNSKITRTNKIWFNLNSEMPRLYNPNKSKWGYLKYSMGYPNFDNNSGGVWTRYISIPISTAPVESIQYKFEIAGDNINVYSNDGTTVLATGTGGLDFWGKVQNDGKDIRVFDEIKSQNYFWIEEFDYTNQKCIIWVKLNAGQTELNIAYGNDSCIVSDFNNGDMTFEFFDDFEINNGWTIDANGTTYFGVDGTWLRIYDDGDSSTHYAFKDIGLQPSQVVEYKWKIPTATQLSVVNYFLQDSSFSGISSEHHYSAEGVGLSGNYERLNNENIQYPLSSTSVYKTVVLIASDLTTSKITYEIGNETNSISLSSIDTENLGSYWRFRVGYGNTYTCDFYIDYMFIRKYIADLSFGTPTIQQF